MTSHGAVCGVLLAGLCALAACSGATPQGYAAIQPCLLPSGTTVTLAYPVPGATNVPDALGQVVVAVSSPLPGTWQVVLGLPPANYAEPLLSPIAPSAIPSPYAAPTSTPISYESSLLSGALPSGTLVQVLLFDQSSTCNALPQVGTFTTQ